MGFEPIFYLATLRPTRWSPVGVHQQPFAARLELRQTHPSGLPSWSGCFQPAKKNTAASSAFTDFIFMTFVQAHLRRKDQLLKP